MVVRDVRLLDGFRLHVGDRVVEEGVAVEEVRVTLLFRRVLLPGLALARRRHHQSLDVEAGLDVFLLFVRARCGRGADGGDVSSLVE